MRKMIVLILVILALGIAPVTAGGTAAKSSNPLVARLSSLNGQAFDVAFTQALIPIDEEAVEMAMTATLYADHSTLLRWNQDFVERKNKEIRKMLALLQSMGARPNERRGSSPPRSEASSDRRCQGSSETSSSVAALIRDFFGTPCRPTRT